MDFLKKILMVVAFAGCLNSGFACSSKTTASKDIEINPVAVFQTLSNAASEFGKENQEHAGIATVFSTVLSLFASLVKQDMEESSKRELLRSIQTLCDSYSDSVNNELDCVKQKDLFPILRHCSKCGSKEQRLVIVRELLTSGPEETKAFVDELFGYISVFITNRLNFLQKVALEVALNFLSEEAGVSLPSSDLSEMPDSFSELEETESEIEFVVDGLGQDQKEDDDIENQEAESLETEDLNNEELINSISEVTEELSLMMFDSEDESKFIKYPYLKKTINFTSDEEFSNFVLNIITKGGAECEEFVVELASCAKDILELQVEASIKNLKEQLLSVNFEPYKGLSLETESP